MTIAKSWKIAGATAALTGFGVGAVLGLTPGAADSDRAGTIDLRDERPAATAPAPAPVAGDDLDPMADLSPDGESIDSPLQSPDDSPDGLDSIDTPGEGPNGPDAASSVDWNSVRSPASPASVASPQSIASPAAPASVASVASVASPEPPHRPPRQHPPRPRCSAWTAPPACRASPARPACRAPTALTDAAVDPHRTTSDRTTSGPGSLGARWLVVGQARWL